MKRKIHTILAASAVSAFACSALAQDTTATKPKAERPDYSQHESAKERRADRLNGAAKASELIGMDVKNYQDEKLGTVDDLGVDMESGRVVQVILSSGGFIGIGSSLTAVPPGALHHDTAAKVLHLNADKAKLESAPKFDNDKWEESSSSNRLAAIYRHYGEEPAFNFIGDGQMQRDGQRNPTDRNQTDRNPTDQRNPTDRNPTDRNPADQRTQSDRDEAYQRNPVYQGNPTDQRNQAGRNPADLRDQAQGSQTDQRNQTDRNSADQRNQAYQGTQAGQGTQVGQGNQTGQRDQTDRNSADQRNQAYQGTQAGQGNEADQRNQTDQRNQAYLRDQTDRNSADQRTQTGQTSQAGQANQADQRYQTADQRTQAGQSSQTNQRSQTDQQNVVTRNNDQTWDQSRSTTARQAMIPSERLGKVQRASKLIGMTVKNRQDETIGDVENLLVDLSSGRLVAVVVSSGGFLGMGDALSAVPPTALQFSADRDSLQLDTTKEKLTSAPHFKSNQWPDFAQPEQAGGVYRAYEVEPYFATDGTTDVDNTDRNERDRNDQTLTPTDQGNSPADIRTTASIRKEIGAANNMSVNAKNVKIITKDGKVTLRGPVNSADEKRVIGEIANRIARAANVDNQLEVKLTTSGN